MRSEGEGRAGGRHARRLRRLQGQQGLGLHRRLGRHGAGGELAGRRRRGHRPARLLERPALRFGRLQGHAGDAAERQRRGRLRAGSTLQKDRHARAESRTEGDARSGAAAGRNEDQISSRLAGIRSLGFSLDATDKGLRTRATTLLNGKGADLPEPFSPDLLSRVPANSWFAASFGNLGTTSAGGRSGARQQPGRPSSRWPRSRRPSASSWTTSTACSRAIRPSTPGPARRSSAGLLLHPSDPSKGATTLRALTKLLASQGINFTDTADGRQATVQGFAVRWRSVGDVLAIGSDPAVGDVAKDSIVDSDSTSACSARTASTSGAETLGSPTSTYRAPRQPRQRVRLLQQPERTRRPSTICATSAEVLSATGRDGDTVTSRGRVRREHVRGRSSPDWVVVELEPAGAARRGSLPAWPSRARSPRRGRPVERVRAAERPGRCFRGQSRRPRARADAARHGRRPSRSGRGLASAAVARGRSVSRRRCRRSPGRSS